MKKKSTSSALRYEMSALALLLFFLALVELYPVLLILFTALKTVPETVSNPFGPPSAPKFGNFQRAWIVASFGRTMLNSLFVTVVSIVGIVALGSLASFPLARRPGRWHKTIYIIFLSLIMVPF